MRRESDPMTSNLPAEPRTLECRALSPVWREPLIAFLRSLEASGDDRWFHPHPFTDEAVERLSRQGGRDVYCVLVEGGLVLGYGMLRGWDEGFDVPSLGIAIAPTARHQGLGGALMHFLHAVARRQGATRVRLRVDADNADALATYTALRYQFAAREGPYLVGIVDLVPRR
jgi:[ribosomal protein S18]-alanine N-acetyltransferase